MFDDLAAQVGTSLTDLLPAFATVVGVLAGIVATFAFGGWILGKIRHGAQGRA